MDHKEALEFLELTESDGHDKIEARYREKYNFFKMLHTNAPTPPLRAIQQKNLDKLEEIKDLFRIGKTTGSFGSAIPPPVAPLVRPSAPAQPAQPAQSNGEAPVAWLVLHTENRNTESLPLYTGENAIGRSEKPGTRSLLLSDGYVSRYHCSIFIVGGPHSNVRLMDDSSNGRTPSRNGTYVNASPHRIAVHQLQEGDTVQIGYSKFVFRWNSNTPLSRIEQEVAGTSFLSTVVIDL